MKAGTPHHPKTTRLLLALGVPRYAAVGILESLWHFAATYADDGNLARFTDEDIAAALEWETEASGELLAALESSGWLDGRQIHDWEQHAPEYIQRRLRQRENRDVKRDEAQRSAVKRDEAQRSAVLQKVSPTDTDTDTDTVFKRSSIDESDDDDQKLIRSDQIEELRPTIRQIATVLRNGRPRGRLPDRDRDEAIKLAWLATHKYAENWLHDALEGVRLKRPKKPAAYLHRSLDNACKKLGTTLNTELKRLKVEEDQPP